MKKKLAIFDIDGTIFRSSLFIELVNQLIKDGIFNKDDFKTTYKKYNNWINRKGSYDDYLYEMFYTYLKSIQGCYENDVIKSAHVVFENHKDKVYRYTRDLIKTLKKEGYFLFALSGSPKYLVQKFAAYYNFDYYIGSEIEVKNKVFTEKIILDPSRYKKIILENFLKDSNYHFNLSSSIGVGDTDSDIQFLEMVGNPIAFNPSSKLLKHAEKEKWKIVVERKDVIFYVKDFEIIKSNY